MSAIGRSLTCLILVLGTASGAAAEDRFLVTELAPDLLMLSTDQGSYCNNSLVFTGEDGVLLVDTQATGDAEAFKEFVKGLGFGAPRYIISTHRHVEHIGGNAVFGPDPIGVAHRLFPDKLRSGTFLFNEYPPEAFPDITFADSLEIYFNGEVIRLVDIGGSHDDNEIMVHFTGHGIAHISSVVNGFNFPSVDSDGDVLQFEPQVRRLMTLLPPDVRLVSGHNGQASGFDFVGSWAQLPDYADMMRATVDIVRQQRANGATVPEMQEAGVLDAYEGYAGSYVGTEGWIATIDEALSEPREARKDICLPVYETWKKDGAKAAVEHYRILKDTASDEYDEREFVLLSIGAKLLDRGLHQDAREFLLGSVDIYPDSEYGYYTHYLLAKGFAAQQDMGKALEQCEESVRLNSDFTRAKDLMVELENKGDE
jgi:cyclase